MNVVEAAQSCGSVSGENGEGSAVVGSRWFCVHCQPKHEHIAAARLRLLGGVGVFLPQIRFRRATVRGPVWFTEALFPNYLFAQFEFERWFDSVKFASGVRTIVNFGRKFPTVPDEVVGQLREQFDDGELRVICHEPEVGESVEIVEGPFAGMQALVERVMPASQRVKVLLDVLGRSTGVELGLESVLPERSRRRIVS